MSVVITINGDTAAEVASELFSLVSAWPSSPAAINAWPPATPVTGTVTAPPAEAPKTPRASRAATKAAEPEVTPPATESQVVADFDGDSAITPEQLRAKAATVAQSGKQAEVKALLTQFGAASISAVPEDQRTAFMAALEAL